MRRLLFRVLSWIGMCLLGLRYNIKVKNLDHLQKEKGGGILFLPNHPAEVDPIIINALLMRSFRPRPLVIEHFYYLSGAHFFMSLVRALPVPNFDISANKWKVRQVDKCLQEVQEGLSRNENFLIYPSGHLKSEGHESIGGNSFIHRILEACPDIEVVLIRTTGLWGSSFSRALTGQSPDFWKALKKGVKTILKNGIFFTPKRKVEVEFCKNPEGFPYQGTRLELNQFLEKWYNQYEDEKGNAVASEPLRLISFSLLSKELPTIAMPKEREKPDKALEVPKDVQEEVQRELAKMSGYKANEIREDMELSRDLGFDSLDLAQVQAFLDQRYDIEAVTPQQVLTVRDLYELIIKGKAGREKRVVEYHETFKWPEEHNRPDIKPPEGKTIQEAFLSIVKRMGTYIACADEVSGLLSYNKLKLASVILAQKFEKLSGQYIGVLLPSSVASYLVILALLFAGKTPVVLNWTAGVRNLNFAKKLLGIQVLISARRFLERVDALDLGDLEDDLLLMEELKREVSLWDKLAGLFLAKKNQASLMRRFHLNQVSEEDPAVILFTSGTETFPKAVPLSHKNLLANQKAAIEASLVEKSDTLYGVLPPFHSFGFNVTGLLPLFAGLKVFYAPDPTDAHGMARDVFQRKVTLLCCAPSFYRNLFRVAPPDIFKTVRLFVSGAEKASKELFESVQSLGGDKKLIEGYGITECSPIVTINRQGQMEKGVGKPLPELELCTVHPETGEKLLSGKEGEICIKGPSVFTGYLGKEVPNPFLEIEGEKWYRSGDLGHIDEDGALILGGRLKRFVKIGGEMVSLGALEEELEHFAKEKGWIPREEQTPQLAVGALEKETDKPILILFTTFPAKKEEVNLALRESGFGRIVKIAEVRQIDEIPMTGTGKVQFRRINEMMKEENG